MKSRSKPTERGLGVSLKIGRHLVITDRSSNDSIIFEFHERRGNEARFKIVAPPHFAVLRDNHFPVFPPPEIVTVDRGSLELLRDGIDLLGKKGVANALNKDAAEEVGEVYLGVRQLVAALLGVP